jgi:hypothetical protein
VAMAIAGLGGYSAVIDFGGDIIPIDEISMHHGQKAQAAYADGTGKWSRAEIKRRYRIFCRQFGSSPRQIDFELAGTSYHNLPWIMPVIRQVIEGIAQNDPACAEIGIELVEEDAKFAFGKIMKANVANALRRATLREEQKRRIRGRVTSLLAKGIVPHEMHQYARLMKRIGLGSQADVLAELHRHMVEAETTANPYVLRFVRYLLDTKQGPRLQ